MILKLDRIKGERIGLWVLLCMLLIAISTITRIVLAVKSFSQLDFTLLNDLEIILLGLFYDLANAIYFSLPLVLYLWLIPERIYKKPWHRFVLYTLFFIFSFLLIFNGIAEFFFWDEFNVRFNFIAVDYLVYTTEVVGNIHQSYPLEWIISAVILLCTLMVYFFRSRIKAASSGTMHFKTRSKYIGYYAVVFMVILFTVTSK